MCEIKIKPYEGYIEKLKKPIELKGRVIRYKPVAKLRGKIGAKKGRNMKGGFGGIVRINYYLEPDNNENPFNECIEELLEFNKSNIFSVDDGGFHTSAFRDFNVSFNDENSMDKQNFNEELSKLKELLFKMKEYGPKTGIFCRFTFDRPKNQPEDYINNSITHYNDFLTKLKEEIES